MDINTLYTRYQKAKGAAEKRPLSDKQAQADMAAYERAVAGLFLAVRDTKPERARGRVLYLIECLQKQSARLASTKQNTDPELRTFLARRLDAIVSELTATMLNNPGRTVR
ncbi:hypothetical protein [Ktedonospora formicarum]|uniref:Uncharacterized protein n=1 Tax=Ktedonospora formicarum TaxID=2778364 RepID=A0A8J3HWJ2_9CHLR|nr:hypothetical protein [Ktedonospora formicarum]GHO44541.1 hypothetical protein KSX_27040 [Ktedonospora formicarum]